MGLGSLEAALTRPAEALRGAPVGFHLRHNVYSKFISLATYSKIFCCRYRRVLAVALIGLGRYSLFLRCNYHDHLPPFELRHLLN
jgi:hypothetical protein